MLMAMTTSSKTASEYMIIYLGIVAVCVGEISIHSAIVGGNYSKDGKRHNEFATCFKVCFLLLHYLWKKMMRED